MGRTEGAAVRRINPYRIYEGRDALQIEKNESTHYSVKTDRQIKVPIGDVDEFLRKLDVDG